MKYRHYYQFLKSLSWLIPAFIAASCTHSSTSKEATGSSLGPAASSSGIVTTVQTAEAAERPFMYIINSNGKIRSLNEQSIISLNGGKLTSCNATAGKFFHAGQAIAQLDTAVIQFKKQRAVLNQYNTAKEYESQLLGYENLLKGKSREEAESIKQKLRISSGLASAEQDLKEAAYDLGISIIKAPFNGITADVKVHDGDQLNPGQEMFKIYDPDNLYLQVKVLEADMGLLKIGIPATVVALSAPSAKYASDVYEINPYVDENGMVDIKVKIRSPKSGRPLVPGMNCTVSINIPTGKSVVVPKEAVIIRSGRPVVFNFEDGKAKWNYVVPGRDNGKEIEIKEGLKAGSLVITSNNLQLAHDAPVQKADSDK